MITSEALQTIIESIEALTLEEQAFLFNLLHSRWIEWQHQSNTGKIAQKQEELKLGTEIVPVENTSTQSERLRLAGKLKENPLFDEVLGYMEAYRRELDAETEAHYHQPDNVGFRASTQPTT